MTESVLLLLIATGLLTYVVTFPLRNTLVRLGFIDRPDERRKLHSRVMPVGGGVAVFLGLTVGLLWLRFGLQDSILQAVDKGRIPWPGSNLSWIGGFLAAAALLVGFGLLDDRFGLRGRQKLCSQFAVSILAVWLCGLTVAKAEFFGIVLDFGWFGAAIAVLWLVGSINAVNLLDGADGMASVVGIAIGLGLAGLAVAAGRPLDAILPAILVAALVGFLPHNFPPAKIFLGDTGSQLIGLTLGFAAIRASLKSSTAIAMTAVIAIWFVPLLDVGVAILRRKLAGRSIYVTDRGHLHHRLVAKGYGGGKLLAVVGLICGVTAIGGVISVWFQFELLALGAVGSVLSTLVLKRIFGHSEAKLLAENSTSFARSMFSRRTETPAAKQVLNRIQGSRDWELLWDRLIAYAGHFDLVGLRLEVHLPSIEEDFVAKWSRDTVREPERIWRTSLPLATDRGVAGRLEVRGLIYEGNASTRIARQIENLKLFEFVAMSLIAEELGWELPVRPKLDPEWIDQVLLDEFLHPEGKSRESFSPKMRIAKSPKNERV